MTSEGPEVLASWAAVLAACTEWFGPLDVVADHSWPHGESRVVELVARNGGEQLIAKWSRRRVSHDRERLAYEQFVSALGDLAPRLLQHHDELRLLVTTRVDGEPVLDTGDALSPPVHRRAGALYRRLHATGWHPWVQDLVKPTLGEWRSHPALQAALLDGYGSGVDDSHAVMLDAMRAQTAVSTVVWDHEHRDPAFEAVGRLALADVMHSEGFTWPPNA